VLVVDHTTVELILTTKTMPKQMMEVFQLQK